MKDDLEDLRTLTVELEGEKFTGSFRVMAGTVVVYLGVDIKYASYGMDRPEVVALWLLRDLCRRRVSQDRKLAKRKKV